MKNLDERSVEEYKEYLQGYEAKYSFPFYRNFMREKYDYYFNEHGMPEEYRKVKEEQEELERFSTHMCIFILSTIAIVFFIYIQCSIH